MKDNNTTKETRISISNGILICGVISALAAYFALPGRSIVASLPIIAICAAICAFIPTHDGIKALMLPLMTLVFASVTTGNTLHAVYMALLALIFCVLCIMAKRLTEKKKALMTVLSVLIICLSLLINTFFCGFIGNAVKSDGLLKGYVSSSYAKSVEYGDCYYDHTSGLYKLDVSSHAMPTEKRSVYVMGGVVFDSYKSRTESILTVPVTLLLTSTLRTSFPSADFSVTSADIIGFSPDKLDPSSQDVHGELMQFTVRLGGMMTKEQFFEKAKEMALTLQLSNVDFCRVTFVGGNGMNDLCSLTVRKEMHFAPPSIDEVQPYRNDILSR